MCAGLRPYDGKGHRVKLTGCGAGSWARRCPGGTLWLRASASGFAACTERLGARGSTARQVRNHMPMASARQALARSPYPQSWDAVATPVPCLAAPLPTHTSEAACATASARHPVIGVPDPRGTVPSRPGAFRSICTRYGISPCFVNHRPAGDQCRSLPPPAAINPPGKPPSACDPSLPGNLNGIAPRLKCTQSRAMDASTTSCPQGKAVVTPVRLNAPCQGSS